MSTAQTFQELEMGTEHVCNISLIAHGEPISEPRRSWNVYLKDSQTPQVSSSFIISDPFDEDDYHQVRWYLEEYAVSDPYSGRRATEAVQSQQRYQEHLCSALKPHLQEYILNLNLRFPEECSLGINLFIHGDGTRASLHSLLWEIIERSNDLFLGAKITVARVCSVSKPIPLTFANGSQKERLNILYVSARPGLEDDISYRAISRHIWDLMKQKRSSNHDIQLHFVRPGTWQQFKAALKGREKGYYDLVHFDMHGTLARSKTQEKAVLHFSPAGTASKKPDKKTAESIADVLAECGVLSAVLNACTAARPGANVTSNFAGILASSGIRVAAMVYKVKTDAAVIAMRSLYQALFSNLSCFEQAVRYSRSELRKQQVRLGRYGTHVPCEDEFNFVLYVPWDFQARTESPIKRHAEGSSTTSHRLFLQRLEKVEHSGKSVSSSNIPHISRIQDLDLMALESLLPTFRTVFITGEGGTGKSTLARHIQSWWKETSFARDVLYFHDVEGAQTWIESLSVEDSLQDQQELETGVKYYAHKLIVILDNIESWDPWQEEVVGSRKLEAVQALIREMTSGSASSRLIVFSRLSRSELEQSFGNVVVHEISLPSAEEAFSLYHTTPESEVARLENAAEIEEILKQHRMNLLFISVFLPLLLKGPSKPFQVLNDILDTPDSSFGLLKDVIESPGSGSVLKLASERIALWLPRVELARRMVISFAMFVSQQPADPRLWLFKALELGAFTACEPPVPLQEIERGEINEYYFEDGWSMFPLEWNFEAAFAKVENCFISLGLWRKVSGNGSLLYKNYETVDIHPLLPYLLRYEIVKLRPGFRDSVKHWSILQRATWEHYEIQAIEAINAHEEASDFKNDIILDVQKDIDNLYQAARLGVQDPIFAFRKMVSHSLFSTLNFVAMAQPLVLRWVKLFEDIRQRFKEVIVQKLWPETSSEETVPSAEKRMDLLRNVVEISFLNGKALEALHFDPAVAENSTATHSLCQLFEEHTGIKPVGIDTVLYNLKVQHAKTIEPSLWDNDVLDYFMMLLESIPPDEDVGTFREKSFLLSQTSLASFLSFDSRLIPRTHKLHSLVSSNTNSLAPLVQDILSKTGSFRQLPSHAGRELIFGDSDSSTAEALFSGAEFNSLEHLVLTADLSEHAQRSFRAQVPSNESGYFVDAVAYAMKPEELRAAVESGEGLKSADSIVSVFDKDRLLEVYDKARQGKNDRLEALCLQQLGFLSITLGDEEAATVYFTRYTQIDGNKLMNGLLSFEAVDPNRRGWRDSFS